MTDTLPAAIEVVLPINPKDLLQFIPDYIHKEV
jgi:hypothetical protein